MRALKILSLLSVFFFITFFSCKKDDEEPTNIVFIEDNIDQPQTWYGDKIYVIKAWDFYVNNTLTIQPGTIIKFHPTEGPDMTLGGSGTIIAQGTSAAPIIFTSYKDDQNGGDTNRDGSATQPARKDWGAVNTNGLNGSIFEYCQFYYGGSSTYTYSLAIEAGSNATVRNCLFVNNDGSYDGSGALDASSAGASTVIQNNTFYNNVRPLAISTNFNVDNSNTFHNPANTAQINQYNGIFVYSNHISAARTWSETEVPFVIDNSDWWINSNGTLILGNGVILKFTPESEIVMQGGTASISNYNGTGVYFTSYKDDAHGGDTNGDGTATSPGAGDWGGIYNDVTSTYMTWANILYDSH